MKLRFKILAINMVALIGVLSAVIFITSPLIERSQGPSSVLLFVAMMLAVGLISIIVSNLLLETMVIRRIGQLTHRVDHIRSYRSYYDALNFAGGDEVAMLAKSVNQMLQRIVSSTNEVGELNAKLQEEKAGIEKKVMVRTEQLSAEKARLHASVANLSLGFIMTDAQNNIMLVNQRAQQILGASETSDHHWTLAEIDERLGVEFALLEKLAHSMRSGETADYNEVDYGEHVLRILFNPILGDNHGQPLGAAIVIEDITEQKVLERSRDEFFSIASHELRTPLTAIRGNTALIKQFYQEKVHDPSFDEMVEDIHGSSVRLIQIVNDFLDVSRLEQGKITFKITSFDLTEVLENVVYETGAMANEKGNNIVVDKTLSSIPRVLADKDRVKQIIYNLIGNAMKFTEHGTITIAAHQEGTMIKVTVTDTGLGIAPDSQKLLFRKFQQASNNSFTRESSRGTGLGLYISKLLVNRMGGVISLDHSELGKGTTLSFTVPLDKSA